MTQEMTKTDVPDVENFTHQKYIDRNAPLLISGPILKS